MVIEYKIRFMKDGVTITQSIAGGSDVGGGDAEEQPDIGGGDAEEQPDVGGGDAEEQPDIGGTAIESGGIAVVLGPLVISNARAGKKVKVTKREKEPAGLKDVAPRKKRY